MKTRIVPVLETPKAEMHEASRQPEVNSPPPTPTNPPALPTPPPGQCMAQVILYTASYPTYLMGTGVINPDGSLVVQVPIAAPPVGTPIQVILYWTGGQKFIEGTTTAPDSSRAFGITTTPVSDGSMGVPRK